MLQASPQKIDLQRLLPTLRSSAATCCSSARLRPGPANARLPNSRNSRRQRYNPFGLTSAARATSATATPISIRRTADSLNSRVNLLRHNPMTQFSFP